MGAPIVSTYLKRFFIAAAVAWGGVVPLLWLLEQRSAIFVLFFPAVGLYGVAVCGLVSWAEEAHR
jgi:hypothetical protein